ncbi:MAG: asparagine--tRNA ligase [Bacillota bacterium]|nr:asparagine--tRNA ligase [Bacillota bacterium]
MTLISTIYANWQKMAEQKITISGWIRTSRKSKNFGFVEVNDGSTMNHIQVVYDDSLSNFAEIDKFGISSAIEVSGILRITEGAKQSFELYAESIQLLGESPQDYPLQKKRHSMEFLRTIAHLRPRSNTFQAVFRISNAASRAIHEFFQSRDFIYVLAPIITSSDAEGAGEMFKVTSLDFDNLPMKDGKVDTSQDFFGKTAHLSVSAQLAGEAFAQAFRKIYTFGPTFRAENSNTKRHAAEFWQIEPEISFADLFDAMDLAEDMIKYVAAFVLDHCRTEMAFFEERIQKGVIERLEKVRDSEFKRLKYTEAIDILQKSGVKFEFEPVWGIALQTEHEKYLADEVFRSPLFVYDYPKDVKAFYMRLNDDGKTVAATDLLVPGIGEIIGCSQREERLEVLIDRMNELNMKIDDYDWYIDLRKYGTTKHAGFGLGLERLLMYITGMENIRDVQPFPRTPGNISF